MLNFLGLTAGGVDPGTSEALFFLILEELWDSPSLRPSQITATRESPDKARTGEALLEIMRSEKSGFKGRTVPQARRSVGSER